MARTPEKLRTLLDKLEELPERQYAQMLRSKLDDLLNQLDAPYLDQHPGRRVPAMISKLYSFNLTSPRRVSSNTGFDKLATVATPGQYILPRTSNILIGRDRSFYWCKTAIHSYMSVSYTSNFLGEESGPIFTTNTKAVGDIFSSVIDANGGACVQNNMIRDYVAWSNAGPAADPDDTYSCISADLQFYDKQRGRFFSDAPVPMEFFAGGTYANKALSYNMRLDAGSEIEPRLYLKEFRQSGLTTDAAYNACQAKGYINLVLIGYQELEHDSDDSYFTNLTDPG